MAHFEYGGVDPVLRYLEHVDTLLVVARREAVPLAGVAVSVAPGAAGSRSP